MSDDNLVSAVDHVADSMKLTRVSNIGSKPGSPASKQVLIRATEEDHLRWKEAAEKAGITMSEFIREAVNAAAKDLLECSHPLEYRRWNVRQERCLKCGAKVR
jgi:uncharacterized protein (DUF1778 family)